MGRRVRLGVIAGAFVVAVGVAAPASAATFHFESSGMKLDGTHGYTIRVSGSNGLLKGKAPQAAAITAQKGHASADYLVQGTSTARELQGNFGDRGKVNMKFHVEKVTHPKPPHNCKGKTKRTVGTWKGTLKFRGENGYTKASAKSVDGDHVVEDLKCHIGGGGTPKTHVQLSASSATPGSATFSADVVKRSGAKPRFFASQSSSDGPVSIYRSTGVRGQPSQFTYDPGYTNATVPLPKARSAAPARTPARAAGPGVSP